MRYNLIHLGMAMEIPHRVVSRDPYRRGAIGGRGAEPGRATSRGRAALREPITGEETRSSQGRALP